MAVAKLALLIAVWGSLSCVPVVENGTTAESPVIVIPSDAVDVRVQRTRSYESASYIAGAYYPATSLNDLIIRTTEGRSWVPLNDGEWGFTQGLGKWWRAARTGDPESFTWMWMHAWSNKKGDVVKYTLIADDDGRAPVRVHVLLDKN
jgi:hypothetical protein